LCQIDFAGFAGCCGDFVFLESSFREKIVETTVLFFSQQRLLRDLLECAFRSVPGIVFLPPVSNITEAIQSMLVRMPDVILLDLNPSLFGLRVVKQLRDACPGCRIIVLSSHDDAVTQCQLAAAGVQGFLTKDIGMDEFISAILATTAGEKVFPIGDLENRATRLAGRTALTPRESEVLELIAQGYANKQVAATLGISIKTVEKHRQRVMEKLHAHETAGLSWRAFCLGVSRAA
jgi:DNA-binding NarL/FixJ family response regulator